MEFSNLRVYQPDGTFKTGGLSISGDRIASAEVSADAVDMGGLYAVPGLVDLHFTAAWAAISATARMRLSHTGKVSGADRRGRHLSGDYDLSGGTS